MPTEFDVYNEATGHYVCGPVEGKAAAQAEADRLRGESGEPHFLREVGGPAVAVEIVEPQDEGGE